MKIAIEIKDDDYNFLKKTYPSIRADVIISKIVDRGLEHWKELELKKDEP